LHIAAKADCIIINTKESLTTNKRIVILGLDPGTQNALNTVDSGLKDCGNDVKKTDFNRRTLSFLNVQEEI